MRFQPQGRCTPAGNTRAISHSQNVLLDGVTPSGLCWYVKSESRTDLPVQENDVPFGTFDILSDEDVRQVCAAA
jgi:hypothetical protein